MNLNTPLIAEHPRGHQALKHELGVENKHCQRVLGYKTAETCDITNAVLPCPLC
jgi:hypothetical protein